MRIKVVSLNSWHGGKLSPAILDFLHEQDADIVLLQEMYDGKDSALPERYRAMQVFSDKLGYHYSDFAQAYIDDSNEGEIPHGNAIFSKLPITHRAQFYMAEPTKSSYADTADNWPILPSVLQQVDITILSGASLSVFNMHGVWDLDGDSDSPRRQKMADVILKAIDGKANVVLAGDSNAKATNPAMRRLEVPLKPVFGDELLSTFNMRHKSDPGYATAAVDLMYVSPNIKIIDKSCPDVDVSDHLPIVATLEL